MKSNILQKMPNLMFIKKTNYGTYQLMVSHEFRVNYLMHKIVLYHLPQNSYPRFVAEHKSYNIIKREFNYHLTYIENAYLNGYKIKYSK